VGIFYKVRKVYMKMTDLRRCWTTWSHDLVGGPNWVYH